MVLILLEWLEGYFCFDLLDISFDKVESSLFYFLYAKDEEDDEAEIVFEMLYYRQLKELFKGIFNK